MVEQISNDIILWGAVLGLLVGIIWSLRYVVVLDRKIEALDWKTERILSRVAQHLGPVSTTPKRSGKRK